MLDILDGVTTAWFTMGLGSKFIFGVLDNGSSVANGNVKFGVLSARAEKKRKILSTCLLFY